MTTNHLLRRTAAAAYLDITPKVLGRMAREGAIPVFKPHPKTWPLFDVAELERVRCSASATAVQQPNELQGLLSTLQNVVQRIAECIRPGAWGSFDG